MTLAAFGSLGFRIIGSIYRGWIGNPDSKLKGFSGLDRIKSIGIEIPVVLIPYIGIPSSCLTKSINH